MALFKFRKGSDEPVAPPSPAESIEAMRRRARHRLIGAVVLVLVGVVGFPLLFDTQPRPVAVDIPIEIPDRNKARPLPLPAAVSTPAASAPVTVAKAPVAAPAAPPVAPATAVAPAAPVTPPEPKAAPAKPADKPIDKPAPEHKVAKPEPKPAAKPEPKPEPKPPVDDGAKARALLEGKPVADTPEAAARFVVQVGAFSDPDKARETRLKLERAGLKTYTHVADTKEGKRIRVRTGPYATRAEADRAADKIKGLDLPAAILTL